MDFGLTSCDLFASASGMMIAPLSGVTSINLIESLFWGMDMQ
jgi:hypothetical protein